MTSLPLQSGTLTAQRSIWYSKGLSMLGFIIALVSGCGQPGADSGTADVSAGGVNTASLSWDQPTTNQDSTPLGDLAGYLIYYSQTTPVTPTNSQLVSVLSPNDTTYVLSDLAPGTYYFTVTAVDLVGNESTMSSEVSKTVL